MKRIMPKNMIHGFLTNEQIGKLAKKFKVPTEKMRARLADEGFIVKAN